VTYSDLLSRLAEEELSASKKALELAAAEMEGMTEELRSGGADPDKSQKIKNLKALAANPFSIRCDYLDVDTDEEKTCYLTTANRSLVREGLKIASWTTHLAGHLRQLEVGEDKDIKIGGKDCCITLTLRGDYRESQPDVADALYKTSVGDLFLKSALELLELFVIAIPPMGFEYSSSPHVIQATRSSFSSFCNHLILNSSLNASDLLFVCACHTSCTGSLDRVYRASVPELCAFVRRPRLVVVPQYRLLSEHRTTYTNQDIILGCFLTPWLR